MLAVMRAFLAAATVAVMALAAPQAQAANAAVIDAKVDAALQQLMAQSATARALADKAVGILVFPQIVKGGFGIGGQYGEGALRKNGVTAGYYSIAGGSFGFQIGAQAFSEALFFMTPDALKYLDRSQGFQVGADASVAVVNEGVAVDANSTTVGQPIVAIVFGQQGLMAGAVIAGSKISRIHPK
jgi:lipid-binding SYLF domain-containing protein